MRRAAGLNEMKSKLLYETNRCGEFLGRPVFPADDGGGFGGFSRTGEQEITGKIEQCIAYMNEHLNEPMQVATLASVANVSPSHFFALFKHRTGRSPMDYFTRLRMRQACRLLGSSSASVKEVATALGYDDPFYFSRVFKSVNHVPPSKYRTVRSNSPGDLEAGSLSLAVRAENTLASEK